MSVSASAISLCTDYLEGFNSKTVLKAEWIHWLSTMGSALSANRMVGLMFANETEDSEGDVGTTVLRRPTAYGLCSSFFDVSLPLFWPATP